MSAAACQDFVIAAVRKPADQQGFQVLPPSWLRTLLFGFIVLSCAVASPAASQGALGPPLLGMLQSRCGDGLVDVQLTHSTGGRDTTSVPVDPPPGRPQLHLRLPRSGLFLYRGANDRVNTHQCDQTSFVGQRALYASPGFVARRMDVPYNARWIRSGNLEFAPASQAKPAFDDSGNRESSAARSEWTVNQAARPNVDNAKFCLRPPAPEDWCYAFLYAGSVGYRTGNLTMGTAPFWSMTIRPEVAPTGRPYSVSDLEQHFAIMHALATAVIVTDGIESINKSSPEKQVVDVLRLLETFGTAAANEPPKAKDDLAALRELFGIQFQLENKGERLPDSTVRRSWFRSRGEDQYSKARPVYVATATDDGEGQLESSVFQFEALPLLSCVRDVHISDFFRERYAIDVTQLRMLDYSFIIRETSNSITWLQVSNAVSKTDCIEKIAIVRQKRA